MKLTMCIFFALAVASSARFPPSQNDIQKDVLNRHNHYRAMHKSPNMRLAPDLIQKATECAQYYANKGVIDHSCPIRNSNTEGENLFRRWRSNGPPRKAEAGIAATDDWYNEIKKYDFGHPGYNFSTGHFTQVVWKGSTELGTGVAVKGNEVFVCSLYRPPGNYRDEFKTNVVQS